MLRDTFQKLVITKIEAISCIRRLQHEKLISEEDFKRLKKEVDFDFKYFTVLSLLQSIEEQAIALIEKYQLKTLDSIQLASCINQKHIVDDFVVSNLKLKRCAISENLKVIDPIEF